MAEELKQEPKQQTTWEAHGLTQDRYMEVGSKIDEWLKDFKGPYTHLIRAIRAEPNWTHEDKEAAMFMLGCISGRGMASTAKNT